MVAYNSSGWNVHEKSTPSAYITCLYWTVTTLLTVGFGDISARTNIEKLFAMLTMTFGALISATIFGNVTIFLENLGRSERAYREKMESVAHSMADLDLPAPLQKRVTDFYTLLWNRNKAFGSESILAELPPSFHHEIAGFLHEDLFDKCLLFMDADPVFLRNLASRLRFAVSLPNDDIVREDEPADRMFFIRKGSVRVSNEACGKLTVMKEGNYFGEIGLLRQEFEEELAVAKEQLRQAAADASGAAGSVTHDPSTGMTTGSLHSTAGVAGSTVVSPSSIVQANNKRTASVHALVNCDLYFLTADDWSALLQHYPQYHRLFLLIALVRFKQRAYHDDEDVVSKMFIWQVKRGELRLKYHRKDKGRGRGTTAPAAATTAKTSAANGASPASSGGGVRARSGSIVNSVGNGGSSNGGDRDESWFEESTRDLIRRVSIIDLDRSQQQLLQQIRHQQAQQQQQQQHQPHRQQPMTAHTQARSTTADALADGCATVVRPPTVVGAAGAAAVASSSSSPSPSSPSDSASFKVRSGGARRGMSASGFGPLLPEVVEEPEERKESAAAAATLLNAQARPQATSVASLDNQADRSSIAAASSSCFDSSVSDREILPAPRSFVAPLVRPVRNDVSLLPSPSGAPHPHAFAVASPSSSSSPSATSSSSAESSLTPPSDESPSAAATTPGQTGPASPSAAARHYRVHAPNFDPSHGYRSCSRAEGEEAAAAAAVATAAQRSSSSASASSAAAADSTSSVAGVNSGEKQCVPLLAEASASGIEGAGSLAVAPMRPTTSARSPGFVAHSPSLPVRRTGQGTAREPLRSLLQAAGIGTMERRIGQSTPSGYQQQQRADPMSAAPLSPLSLPSAPLAAHAAATSVAAPAAAPAAVPFSASGMQSPTSSISPARRVMSSPLDAPPLPIAVVTSPLSLARPVAAWSRIHADPAGTAVQARPTPSSRSGSAARGAAVTPLSLVPRSPSLEVTLQTLRAVSARAQRSPLAPSRSAASPSAVATASGPVPAPASASAPAPAARVSAADFGRAWGDYSYSRLPPSALRIAPATPTQLVAESPTPAVAAAVAAAVASGGPVSAGTFRREGQPHPPGPRIPQLPLEPGQLLHSIR